MKHGREAQFTSVCACAKKMATAELGTVRLGVGGFDKEFADWCREDLKCFLLGQVTARGWYVQGSCLSVRQAHSLLCASFPRSFSARLQIEKAGRWASTEALQSVHCHINGLLTCRDFSDFPLWKNVDMDTSQKGVFARLGWIPRLCCILRWWLRSSTESDGREVPSLLDQNFLQPRWLRCGGKALRISRTEALGDFCCSLPAEPDVQGNLFLCLFSVDNQNTRKKDGYKRNKDTTVTVINKLRNDTMTLHARTHAHTDTSTFTRSPHTKTEFFFLSLPPP